MGEVLAFALDMEFNSSVKFNPKRSDEMEFRKRASYDVSERRIRVWFPDRVCRATICIPSAEMTPQAKQMITLSGNMLKMECVGRARPWERWSITPPSIYLSACSRRAPALRRRENEIRPSHVGRL